MTKNGEKQMAILEEMDKLLFQRFNKETLEQKLTEIFGGEKITIELGCEDVSY